MTVPQFLSLNCNDDFVTNAQVNVNRDGEYQILSSIPQIGAGTREQLGLGSDEARIVRFRDGIYVLAHAAGSTPLGGVFRSLDGGNTWTQVLVWSSFTGTTSATIDAHLHVININGTPTLCIFMIFTATAYWWGTSTNGTTWSMNTRARTDGSGQTMSHLILGPEHYMIPSQTQAGSASSNYYLYVNWAASPPTLSEMNVLSTTWGCGCSCYFNGRIYTFRLSTRSITTTTNIYELDRTNSVLVQTITHTTGNINTDALKWDVFTDGTNMYLFHNNNNSDAWQIYQIDSALAVTNITTSVRPTLMATASSSAKVRVVMDQLTNPGSPQYFIYVANNTTTALTQPINWVIYQWNGPASLMTQVDVGGNVMDRISWNTRRTESAPFWSKNSIGEISPHVEILSRATQSNGTINILFTLYSQTGAQTLRVRGFFADLATQEFSTSAATLTNPSQGTLNGAYVENLVGNNGNTIYQVTWNASSDGITSGDQYSFNLEVQVQ